MTAAFIAASALAITGWGAFLVAAIGGNAIRDDYRKRIDGLNAEGARKNQVIDYLTAELHAERRRGQMRVVPLRAVQDARETR